jgi:hypothetical protein
MVQNQRAVTGQHLAVEDGAKFEFFKGINRARDIFRELGECWNDRLVLEGNSYVEHYCRGRMAFIVYCKGSLLPQLEPPRVVREVGLPIRKENVSMLILKADIRELHKLEHWNEQLMLVHDTHVVQGPQGPIPRLVGLYVIDDKIAQLDSPTMVGKPLLFQSAIYGTFKFLPRVSDWKARPFVGLRRNVAKGAVVHQVESASHVMESISNDESSRSRGEFMDKNDENMAAPLVLLDANGVKIRGGKINHELIQVADVLHGPFNLFP